MFFENTNISNQLNCFRHQKFTNFTHEDQFSQHGLQTGVVKELGNRESLMETCC